MKKVRAPRYHLEITNVSDEVPKGMDYDSTIWLTIRGPGSASVTREASPVYSPAIREILENFGRAEVHIWKILFPHQFSSRSAEKLAFSVDVVDAYAHLR